MLRRILDGLSGPGKRSSVPASGPVPVWKSYSVISTNACNQGDNGGAYLGPELAIFQHYRTVAELLNEAVPALDGFSNSKWLSSNAAGHLLA